MRNWLSLIFLCCFAFTSIAQKFSFIQYNTSKGLPQSQVKTITQDNAGYLWIGTFGGLARFDGENFTSFGKNNGLLNNRITSLKMINDQLLIGHPQGISIKSNNHDFIAIPHLEDSIMSNVSSFSALDSTVYIATNGGGLYFLEEDMQRIIHIPKSPNRIREIITTNDALYLATRTGIYKFDGKNFTSLKDSENTSFSGLDLKNNQLYASSFQGDVYQINTTDFTISKVLSHENYLFRDVTFDQNERLWLTSRNGILLVKEKDTIEITESLGLPTNDIYFVFEDSEKNIWIGTNGKGMIRFTDEVFTYFNESSGLPSDLIIAMEMDQNQNKWISTIDKGVFKIDNNGEIIKEEIILSAVWQIEAYQNLVLFASNLGLYIYDGKKMKSYYKESSALPSNQVKGIHLLNDTSFLVSTMEGSVIYNVNSHTLDITNESLSTIKGVRDFEVKDDIIFAAAPNGIFKIDKNFNVEKDHFDSGINSIELDHTGKLWIGTENGLYLKKNGKYERLILEKEEQLEFVNFIQQYDTLMFIGTNNGIYELNTNLDYRYHYGITSGLIDLETNLNSNYLEDNRYLWFGTASGLMKMDLQNRSSLIKRVKPKLQLTGINVNNQPLAHQKIEVFSNAQIDKTLKIKFADKNISFQFDGIYMTNPGSLRYSYFLEGFSDDWSPWSEIPNASFTNLPPGEYLFKVKVNTGSNISSNVFELPLTVTPPFYRTWWFYLIVAFLVFIVIISIDKTRQKKLSNKNYQVKLEFENKLSKLEQQSLNASMNRHFIFNALNSIQYYINAADNKSANKYLSNFAKLIRKNLDSSYRKDGMVTLSDELERLQLYLDLEMMRFANRFTYQINVEEEVESEVLIVPAMFLQPFVENSIIHGVLPIKERQGLIEINVSEHLDHIRIEIKDNGIGIEKSIAQKTKKDEEHRSQGMLIAKGRIELLQKISARSIEMIGPQQIKENDTSVNGTIVVFKIMKQYLE